MRNVGWSKFNQIRRTIGWSLIAGYAGENRSASLEKRIERILHTISGVYGRVSNVRQRNRDRNSGAERELDKEVNSGTNQKWVYRVDMG